MSNTELQDTGAPSCTCADPDVDRLRALVAAGHDQIEASRLIWGGPGLRLPPTTEPEVS